jgi:hypothetical protein
MMSEILLRRNSTQAVMPIIRGMSLKVVMKSAYIHGSAEVVEVIEAALKVCLLRESWNRMIGLVALFAFFQAQALPSHLLLKVV